MTPIILLNDETFERVERRATRPLVVDFWASWCTRCHTLSLLLEELVSEYAERAQFARVNIDECAGTARRFDIRIVPSILVLHRRRIVARVTGTKSAAGLRRILDAAL